MSAIQLVSNVAEELSGNLIVHGRYISGNVEDRISGRGVEVWGATYASTDPEMVVRRSCLTSEGASEIRRLAEKRREQGLLLTADHLPQKIAFFGGPYGALEASDLKEVAEDIMDIKEVLKDGGAFDEAVDRGVKTYSELLKEERVNEMFARKGIRQRYDGESHKEYFVDVLLPQVILARRDWSPSEYLHLKDRFYSDLGEKSGAKEELGFLFELIESEGARPEMMIETLERIVRELSGRPQEALR